MLPGVDVTATQTDTGLKRNAIDGGRRRRTRSRTCRRSVQRRSDAAGLPHVRADRHRAAGRRLTGHQRDDGDRRRSRKPSRSRPTRRSSRRSNLGVGQVMDNKRILELPIERPQYRRPARGAAGRGPAAGAQRDEPQHGRQQRRHRVLAGGWRVVRRLVRARRRDAQQPVRQPQPAAAVPGRDLASSRPRRAR